MIDERRTGVEKMAKGEEGDDTEVRRSGALAARTCMLIEDSRGRRR